MTWLTRICLTLCMVFMTSTIVPSSVLARDLTHVTVLVKIENPDYFWQYPFLGKQLDRVSISSFGKTYTIAASSDSEKIEVDVPTDYYLRMNMQLQSGGATLQNLSYSSKHRVRRSDQTMTIVLKAPEPQSIKISSEDFEAIRP